LRTSVGIGIKDCDRFFILAGDGKKRNARARVQRNLSLQTIDIRKKWHISKIAFNEQTSYLFIGTWNIQL